jgi:hypothetical protein
VVFDFSLSNIELVVPPVAPLISGTGDQLHNFHRSLPGLQRESARSELHNLMTNFSLLPVAEHSLCKQLERETLREYYHKFLTLKSQLPSVDDQIAIHYAISGLRAGFLYSHCIRDPPRNL